MVRSLRFPRVHCEDFPRALRRRAFRVWMQQDSRAGIFGLPICCPDQIAPITDKESIAAIERAQSAGALRGAEAHLQQALRLLSDRQQPDYRNSIKESICAIEAICRAVSRNSKATLGDALKAMGPKVSLHPALSGAFDKLYGYTSDADGIRHALLDTPTLEQEDALFMLVSCSAFIDYLAAKCARAGIAL